MIIILCWSNLRLGEEGLSLDQLSLSQQDRKGEGLTRSLARSLAYNGAGDLGPTAVAGGSAKEGEGGGEKRTGGGKGQGNECCRSPRSQCPT